MEPGLIIFQFTNAYDVYSADALNSLGDIIYAEEIKEDGYYLYVKDIAPVLAVMVEYGFTCEIIEGAKPGDVIASKVHADCTHPDIRNVGSWDTCDRCGKFFEIS